MEFKLWLEAKADFYIFLDVDETLVKTVNDISVVELEKHISLYAGKELEGFRKRGYERSKRLYEVYKDAPRIKFPTENRIVIARPGLHEFLRNVQPLGHVYMLSAGSQDYIEKVADVLNINNMFEGLFSVKGGILPTMGRQHPPQVASEKKSWVLVDDLGVMTMNTTRKFQMLGANLEPSDDDYGYQSEIDEEKTEEIGRSHLIRIQPFDGDSTKPDAELSRVLSEIRKRIG